VEKTQIWCRLVVGRPAAVAFALVVVVAVEGGLVVGEMNGIAVAMRMITTVMATETVMVATGTVAMVAVGVEYPKQAK
jgi:hypothetical protein